MPPKLERRQRARFNTTQGSASGSHADEARFTSSALRNSPCNAPSRPCDRSICRQPLNITLSTENGTACQRRTHQPLHMVAVDMVSTISSKNRSLPGTRASRSVSAL